MISEIERSLNKYVLLEDNSTSGEESYDTPYAFRKVEDEDEDEDDTKESDIFEQIFEEKFNNIINKINEIAYTDYKKDESKSLKKKINDNINFLNRQLRISEQLLDHALKLKTETSSNRTIFFKNTLVKFLNISNKLGRIQSKLREFSV